MKKQEEPQMTQITADEFGSYPIDPLQTGTDYLRNLRNLRLDPPIRRPVGVQPNSFWRSVT